MENEPKKLSSERLLMFNNPGQCSPKVKKKIDNPPTLPGTGRQDDILDSPVFQKPMRLTETTNGKVQSFPETLKEINKIGKTLNIVSVVGTLRTGKSFLLNKLVGIKPGDPGFEMGHTPTAVTKGIWVMCRQHPTQKDQVLVLLDTEGIDDPKKVPHSGFTVKRDTT
ncbi:guanylate-binding protein 1-like [Mercenaria mercenaria]|uniref:guanylate-binding protein 1-like n=1 Tax=Mercenaria mercenaria TaxID=6596 RepID=UPI00234EBC5A|nr:guanylate-binding protein 1-like [Mercenaria mercenaria]XP_053376185.1 guanylate-binding protein 1-like [Mercenaria mercenaria]